MTEVYLYLYISMLYGDFRHATRASNPGAQARSEAVESGRLFGLNLTPKMLKRVADRDQIRMGITT
jgi:hypothetical protein